MPPEPPPAALRLEIDRKALAGNWRRLDALSGGASAGAAVKADAYGLGVSAAVPVLCEAGCRDFFVAHWGEAAEVAALAGPEQVAVLHGPMTGADAAYARALGVRPVINSLHQARLWRDVGGGSCDLMVDTGINRLGVPLAEIGDAAIAALSIDVLHSHLASADEDTPFNAAQLARWHEARALVTHRRAALANSAGIALGADYHGDQTRPGLALYGGIPRPELRAHIQQVARPMAALMQVRDLSPGDSVGYNRLFVAECPMRIGTVSLGYADGYLRCWTGKGVLLAGAQPVRLLGRVSMDMTVVDLTNAPDAREGDWLQVPWSLPEAAAESGLSQYELLTMLGRRFARAAV